MFSRRFFVCVVILASCSVLSFTQRPPSPSPHPALHEFPLALQQNIESGKVKIGTKVQARLATATMFRGTVIPRDAVFTGVVIESDAKNEKYPAKIAIRMETAEWKGGSTSLTAYLLPLWYPPAIQTAQGPPNGSDDTDPRTLDGGQSQSPMQQRPFPTNDSQAAQSAIPEFPTTSNRPVQMRNVALVRADEGGAALVSEHTNIRLNKFTTYVFAAIEPITK